MEVIDAAYYYWQVLCRGILDTYQSVGLWTLIAAVFSIAVGCAAHFALIRFFPSLKDRLGELMHRWWIWLIYTLVPLGLLTLLMSIFNIIMAPARMHYEQAGLVPPAVGDPQDSADIRTLTRKLFATEEERDTWRDKYNESDTLRIAAIKLRDEARQFNDRFMRRRDGIAKWIVRIEEFQNSLSNETPRSMEDFRTFANEFGAFANNSLDDGERALLESTNGLPQYLTARNLEGNQLDMYKILWRWGLRLNQFMSPADVGGRGLLP